MRFTSKGVVRRGLALALLLALVTPACLAQKELDGEGKDHARLRETMEIMKRILSEDLRVACRPTTGAAPEDAVRALVSGSGCERAFYVPEMGVVFLFDLQVPLQAVTDETRPEPESLPTSDRWQKAASSIRQSGSASWLLRYSDPSGEDVRYEHSREAIDRLSTAALLALAEHGSNFSELDAEESLAVVMEIKLGASAVYASSLVAYQELLEQSPSGEAVPPSGGGRYRTGPGAHGLLAGASAPDCHLVVRIRRCDADDFARGRLTPAELRRRARVDLF